MTRLNQHLVGAISRRFTSAFIVLLSSLGYVSPLFASEAVEDSSGAGSVLVYSDLSVEGKTYRQVIEFLDPMDLDGMSAEVADILSDYYSFNFTSTDRWAEIQSIQFEGSVSGRADRVDFIATKKKPDYCKIVLSKEGRTLATLAYDGQEAWQSLAAEGGSPVLMSEGDASNFIRDTITGGNLFYARLPGKTIELKGTKVVSGRRCHELLVTLTSGEQVTYMLGVLDLREYQQIAYNAVTGREEVTTHLEYKNFEGVRFPVLSEMRVDGELVHTVEIHDLQFNRGFTTWMFRRAVGGEVGASSASSVSSVEVVAPLSSSSLPATASSSPFSPFAQPSVFDEAELETSSRGFGRDFPSPSAP